MTNPPSNPEFLLCFSRGFIWRLLVLAGIILVAVFVGRILLVIFAGIMLAILLRAITVWLQGFAHLSARWSYVVVLLTILIATAGIGFLLGPEIVTQVHQIAKAIPRSFANLVSELNRYQWGRDFTRILSHSAQTQQAAGSLSNYASDFGGLIEDAIVILAVALFIAANPSLYRRGLLQLIPEKFRATGVDLFTDVASTVQYWLIGQLIPMAVLGTGTMIGLWALGVPLAFTLALFTALMLFIPYVGSIMAFIPTALIALIQGPRKMAYVAILYLAVHIAEGYVITPIAQRRAVRLPPALTLIAQLFMWRVAGLLGVVVATPLAAVGLVIVQKLYLKRQPDVSH